MKYGYVLLLVLSSYLLAVGQSSVMFQTLPRDLQLYPRNAANQATIVVEGTVTDASARRVTIQVDRAGKLSQAQQTTLTASRTFRFEPVIKAEMAEYTLRVYLHRQPGDSLLLAERKRLVCGDLFLIYGQSNAFGLDNLDKITLNDQFMRQCGYVYGASDIPASMQWFPALQPYAAVGAFGLFLGEAIQKAVQIPVGFINGAEGGASIGQLSDRNAANPTDLNTFYGRMLYRTQWAGAQQQVKAIFYRQGEAEAGSSTVNYAADFDRLYRMLRQDYGPVPRLYVGQLNLLTSGSAGAGALRDFQRRLPEIYPDGVSNIATVGSVGYDGLHYDLPGQQQMGYEQARQVLREQYASGESERVNSPNVRQVFQNSRNDTLTVVFESAMQLRWPADSTVLKNGQTYTRRLIDVFLADGQTGRFSGGRAEANRIYLALREPATVQTLTYFPPFYSGAPDGFYTGPTLKNQLGLRAFTFDRYPVARALSAMISLAVTQVTRQEISLAWTVSTVEATAILLERSGPGQPSYTQIARLPVTATSYTDLPTGSGVGPYRYRIRAAGLQAESGAGNVAEGQLLPPCALSATVTGNPVVPFGDTLSLSIVVSGTETGIPVTYLWRSSDGALITTSDLMQPDLVPDQSGVYGVTVTQGDCAATTSVSVTIQWPLATEPLSLGLTAWPNPVRAGQPVQLNVPEGIFNELVIVRLFDILGKEVFHQTQRRQPGTLTVPLPLLPPGLYVIDLKPNSAKRQTCRLLIE